MEIIVASRGNPTITQQDLQVEYDNETIFRCQCATASRTFFRDDASDEKRSKLFARLSDGASPEQAREASDVFLAGHQFQERSLSEISRQFGDEFAYGFASQTELLGEWVAPFDLYSVATGYGSTIFLKAE